MTAFAQSYYNLLNVVWILSHVNRTERAELLKASYDRNHFFESTSMSNYTELEDSFTSNNSRCSNGFGFNSLTDCQEDCKFHGTGDNVHRIKSNVHINFSYKLLTLKHNTYNIKDGKLIAARPVIETIDFTLKNGTAFICYKLPYTFVECMQRCVKKENLTLSEGKTRLYVKDYKRSYQLDEFYLINDPKRCIGAGICISEITTIFTKLKDIHLIFDSLSAACLWLTFILCFILPQMDVRQNRALLYHLAMFAIGYTVICWKSAIMMFFRFFLTDAWCISLSSIQQFTLLSAFFWMNLQSYELYSSLRQPLWPDILQCFNKKRWIFHWLCGWLLPLILTMLALGFEVFVSVPGLLTPGFTEECWFKFNNKGTLFIWFYGWMALSLAVNLVLCFFIMKSLREWNKETEMANGGTLIQTFVVLVKLMFIMGFCWVVNLLRWSIVSRDYVYYALDLLTSLHGVFIFVAYVCRRRVWLKISGCRKANKKGKSEIVDTEL